MDLEIDPLKKRQVDILRTLTPLTRKIYEYLLGELEWDEKYTTTLFKYLRDNIHTILFNNKTSLYYTSDTDTRHIILDNMMSDILEKLIEDRSILGYDKATEKFDDAGLKVIIQGIAERKDPDRKGGKRSKNNKKKSKRKHRHNKKSHKKRR